jgi:predicted MPP superfamily phosphohydrolase
METVYYSFKSHKMNAAKRIVMLSDTHNCEPGSILSAVSPLSPDCIAVAGDIVDRHKKAYGNAVPLLQGLCSIAPVYFSYGNHERRFPVLSREMIENTGAHVLDNEACDDGDITFCGFTPYSHECVLFDLEKYSGYKILLCHNPEYYARFVKRFDFDLVLSGHAHGGQIRLFGHGLFAPGQGIFPKYTKGLYDGRLIVSTGLKPKEGLIPRINNKRQIVVIDIAPKE